MVLVYIKMYHHSGHVLTFEADPGETIRSLKKRIAERHEKLYKIPVKLINLFTANRLTPLKDDNLVGQYSRDKAFFAGYTYLSYDIDVKIVSDSGLNLVVTCRPQHTVFELKQHIAKLMQENGYDQDAPPAEEIELVYYGRRLHNVQKLAEAHIDNNSTVCMVQVKDVTTNSYVPTFGKKFDTSQLFLQKSTTQHFNEFTNTIQNVDSHSLQSLPRTQSLLRFDQTDPKMMRTNNSSLKPLFAYTSDINSARQPKARSNPQNIVAANLFSNNGLSSLGTGNYYRAKPPTISDVYGQGARPKPYEPRTKVRMVNLSQDQVLAQNDTWLKPHYRFNLLSQVHENPQFNTIL